MLDILLYLLAIIALGMIIPSIRQYAGTSIGATFVYFFVGTMLLGSSRLLHTLAEAEVIVMHEMTLMYLWHFIFYLAMACFVISAYALTQLVNPSGGRLSFSRSFGVSVIFIVLALGIFLTAGLVNPFFELLEGTFWDWSGFPHFIAFLLAGTVSYYLFRVKKQQDVLASIALPLLISMAFFSFAHFYELLLESWHVIMLPMETIELYEGVIWILGFITLIATFARFRSRVSAA